MQSSFVDPIQCEIAKEQAEGLVRTEKRFLEALEAYRLQGEGVAAESPESGEWVLWDLVDALTSYVVQREACGLRDAGQLYRLYQVPRAAIARIGVRRPPHTDRRGRARLPIRE
jgi:hypothetical protein